MGDAGAVATAFRYPHANSRELLTDAVAVISDSATRQAMDKFAARIELLSLGEWEELHTATLDLSPKFVPYVGHAVWGENYRRGAFMADLSREMSKAAVPRNGELPDHLDPVLRYLDATTEPLGDLLEVLPLAVMRMTKELRKADKRNPYRHALDAVEAVAENLIDERRKAVT